MKKLLVIAFTLLSLLIFIACPPTGGDTNDTGDSGNPENSKLIGEWLENVTDGDIYTFSSGNNFKLDVYYSAINGYYEYENGTYNYNTSTNKLELSVLNRVDEVGGTLQDVSADNIMEYHSLGLDEVSNLFALGVHAFSGGNPNTLIGTWEAEFELAPLYHLRRWTFTATTVELYSEVGTTTNPIISTKTGDVTIDATAKTFTISNSSDTNFNGNYEFVKINDTFASISFNPDDDDDPNYFVKQ